MVCSQSLLALLKKPTLVLLPIWASLSTTTLALPVPDNTLGTQNTLFAPGAVQVDGGTTVGQNLFHSFESFNIGTNESVVFSSPIDINNIFSRVTGDSISEIDGLLGTIGSDADLFLLNPNGVVFGPNASLDVQGSFIVTTADAIALGNNGVFSATDIASDQLLAVSLSAFFFNSLQQPGEIVNQSSFVRKNPVNPFLIATGLQVPNENALVFLGGNVTVDGGQLNAPGGRVEIGAVSGLGEVEFSPTENTLIFPDDIEQANITISNGSSIRTISGSGGDIVINARNLTISNFSAISSGIGFGLGTATSQAGNIQIDVRETVFLLDGSTISNGVIGLGAGGDVTVSAQDVNVLNGSQIGTAGLGSNNIGDVTLQALDTVNFSGRNPVSNDSSGILASVAPLSGFIGPGDGGNIDLSAKQINLLDGALITSSVLSFPNESGILVGSGNSGDITITANNLSATGGANINSSIFGSGNAGSITIEASGEVFFEGVNEDNQTAGGVFSLTGITNLMITGEGTMGAASTLGEPGNAGGPGSSDRNSETNQTSSDVSNDVQISANRLRVQNGARLATSTLGISNAGNLVINAQDSIIFSGTTENNQSSSGAFSTVEPDADGDGGTIAINTRNLEISNGAELSASTFGMGNSGRIQIEVVEEVLLDGTGKNSFIESNVERGAVGDASGIVIETGSLRVLEGSQIQSIIGGVGNSEDIVIMADGNILFNGNDDLPNGRFLPSAIFSGVLPSGNGNSGDIVVVADSLNLENASQLSSTTEGSGNAGDIDIRVREHVSLSNSSLLSEVTSPTEVTEGNGGIGNGGSIFISANALEILEGSSLLADTENQGNAGDIALNIRDTLTISGKGPGGIFRDMITPSQISTSVDGEDAIGEGGDIHITSGDIILTDGGFINSGTSGSGPAGDITLIVNDDISLVSGEIAVFSNSNSQAGDLEITADRINLDRGSTLNAESTTVDGGNITLDLNSLLVLRNNSQITATAGTEQAGGNGGIITINAPFIIAIPDENSDIMANAFEGTGGQVNLTANGVFGIEVRPFPTDFSDITASSEQGVSGNVILNSPDTSFIENNLTDLPDTLTNPETLIANSCVARSQEAGGTFVISGNNLTNSPDNALPTYPTGTVQVPDIQLASENTIVEPAGIYQTADGRLVMSRPCT